MTPTSDERDTRIPYRLGTDHYCTYEDDGSYVRMGDMIWHVYDTPFGEIELKGELCSVRYGEDGFIDAVSVYVAEKEMNYDVPCEGVFYRMVKDDSSDERHKVAERMRVYSHDFDFGDSNPFCYVANAAFGDVDVHTYYSVFARLADLIDPEGDAHDTD